MRIADGALGDALCANTEGRVGEHTVYEYLAARWGTRCARKHAHGDLSGRRGSVRGWGWHLTFEHAAWRSKVTPDSAAPGMVQHACDMV